MKIRRTFGWLVLGIAMLASLAGIGCKGNGNGSDGGDAGTCDKPCVTFDDCGEEMDCLQGCCESARPCSNLNTCIPYGAVCLEHRCVRMCLNDIECPADRTCVDGMCVPYPADVLAALTGPPVDDGWATRTPLKVGIGDVPLDFPVGVSMAGYGGRNILLNPFSDSNGGSDSMWDRPRVKAFVFDNGLKRIAIVKAPMSWEDDYVVSHVAWRLFQATGKNYLDRIILSSPHSHSHPGRYWNVVKWKKIGVFGHGDFSFEILGRFSQSIADAILAAIDDLQPAKVAYAVNPAMDPEGRIHHDRHSEDQYPLDDSLTVIRIDDPQDHPRGLLVNFALHGTQMKETSITQDAPGAVEVLAQQGLQQTTGHPLKVAFLSGNSGDVSPAGDWSNPTADDWRKTQEVGIEAYPKIKELFDSLEGKGATDLELDIANRRAPLNRQALGYQDGQFIDESGAEYTFGAFQCVGGTPDPGPLWEDGQLGCIFSAALLADGRPIRQFMMVRVTVARLGKLGLITLPGEPLGHYGRGLAQKLIDQGMDYATIMGYSQDHHFYLMDSDTWLRGGYEPSMGIWGWKEADYIAGVSASMFGQFVSQGGFTDNASLKPSWYDWVDDAVVPTATPAADVGKIESDVPAKMARMGMIRFRWIGGHPGVDLPRVTLERQDTGVWNPVTNAAGEVYSDDGFSTMTWYKGNYQDHHAWEVSFEESAAFPAGTYRLKAEGRTFDGSGAGPYSITSGAFDFEPAKLLLLGLSLDDQKLGGAVFYPAGPTNDDGASAFEGLKATGFLRHNGVVAQIFPWPVATDGTVKVAITLQPPTGQPVSLTDVPVQGTGTISYSYVNSRKADSSVTNGQTTLPSATFSATHGAYRGAGIYQVQVTAQDAYGNAGQASTEFTLP